MQRLLLLFLCLAGFGVANAQVVLEDFEDGTSTLPWNAYEGTFEVVANPADTVNTTTPNSTSNTSGFVGSYTKAGDKAYSYFVAELTEPLDLTTNNQISIQVYAGAPTALIMKLEERDATGTPQSIERRINIPTAGVWRTYTFDFSAAADLDALNDIILFFDPGTETSTDTYLFDNIVARPEGPCAGTTVDPTVLDDFECQRNATYGIGYDDIEVIVNPDKSGINTSDSVARYTDRAGTYHALVIDSETPVDLTTNNNLCIKVWAPKTGNLIFKLEGGTTYEQGVQITETETWVEACVDLSGQAAKANTRIVFFFNAGEDGTDDVYYIDDITLTPAAPVEAIEDFEGGAKLTWTTTGDNSGTFNGAIANPDMTGNESDMVGSYTRGSALYSALNAAFNEGIDLTTAPQLNLDVWAPDANTMVTMQLYSPTAGVVNATATMTAAETWETLSFSFADHATIADFESVSLLFAPNTAGTGTYYFDNLSAGNSTVDPCADVEMDMTYLDDFECQRNANFTTGSEFLTVVANPDGGPDSGNTSTTVAAFADQVGGFNALVIDFTDPIDLSTNNQLSVDIWAPVDGQIMFKLEGGTGGDVEIFQDIPEVEMWNTYTVDLSAYMDMGYTRLVMFFGAGGENTVVNTYYFDNLRLTRSAYGSSCVATFESADYTLSDWSYFANGDFDGNAFVISENPDTSGINTSLNVGTFEEAANGETFAGMYTDLPAPIALPAGNKTATMKVWMDVAGTVLLKLEGGIDDSPNSGDVAAEYTTPGEWQELTFDYSALPDGATYGRLTLIMNSTAVPAAAMTSYFDDIAVGGGDCANTTGLFEPVTATALRVYPNPTSSQLTIENPDGAVRFTLTNMLGQQVKEMRLEGAGTQVQWNVENLRVGTYLLTAQDAAGRLVARSVVVKR